MKVGITGQSGFIGTHLYNYIGLQEDIERVTFSRSDFDNPTQLEAFVSSCDTIVHLAAMNRHGDPQVIYDTNISLVNKLVGACTRTSSKPHILFSSSIQEERDNLYGKSKLDGRIALESWAQASGAQVSSLIIPNVFGPFGKPYYNSVVSTFCHQVSHDETPVIENDGLVKMIYINQLVEEFFKVIQQPSGTTVSIDHTKEIKVSKLLETLQSYKKLYIDGGEVPAIKDWFDLALFNTFRCYMPSDHYPVKFVKHEDDRGYFMEIIRTNSEGQYSFSVTKPGITRGNHFHTRKAERFAVIQGEAEIKLRRVDSDEIITYKLNGDTPSYVDIPIWHSHNIKNVGTDNLVTLFWINESYHPDNADTYFVAV